MRHQRPLFTLTRCLALGRAQGIAGRAFSPAISPRHEGRTEVATGYSRQRPVMNAVAANVPHLSAYEAWMMGGSKTLYLKGDEHYR